MDEDEIQETPDDLQAEEAALDADIFSARNPSSLKPVEQADTNAATSDDGHTNINKAPAKGSGTQSAQQLDSAKNREAKDPEATPDAPAKPQTKYEKAVERQNRSWAKLNEEKAALEKQRQELTQREEAAKDKPSDAPSPERLEQVAKDMEAEGDFQYAATARKMAEERRAQIKAEAEKAATPTSIYPEAKFKELEAQAFQQAKADFPEVAIPNSPLNQAVKALVAAEAPVAELIKTSPYGLYFATRYAATHAIAARVPDLEKQVATITAELAQVRSQTSPISNHMVNTPGGATARRFGDLSEREMEDSIEADLYAGR